VKDRYHELATPGPGPRPGIALRIGLRGYSRGDLRADLLAACVVGVVALPLSMALAIASGVPPQHGLYTAIVAGFLIAVLGGSPVQVSGPTAAFVVILAPISARFGLGGLLIASTLAGVILVAMGLGRFGQLIQFVPYPVTAGFTSGIAVVIATLQLRDLLGLRLAVLPEHYLDRVVAIARALPTWRWQELLIGALTMALLLLWPKISQKFPAPLVALGVGALVAFALTHFLPGFDVATIGSRFSYEVDGVRHAGIARLPPLPIWPWSIPGPDGAPLAVSLDLLRELLPAALAIAMLGAIESLLSAVVADGMFGTQHDPDAELVAQGLGNMVAPFFGGFAATGAIARTATNIRAGARTPVAAAAHAIFLLAAVLALAPLLAYLPMASLAALLLLVAWNMSEIKHVVRAIRTAPRNDVAVLLTCLLLTVLFDMVVAVTVGVVMAALLFMRRMAEVSGGRLTTSEHHDLGDEPLPDGVLVYEIAGPLFFGAAQKAMGALQRWEKGVKVVVLDLRSVPLIDATGLVNLESTIARLREQRISVVLAGVQPAPLRTLARAGLRNQEGLAIGKSFRHSLEKARALVDGADAVAQPVTGPQA
jgi:sulfate permease, SulP family